MTKSRDVVIAGGGVAGASAAIVLARAGLRVGLFEERGLGRDKPCGEGLMPSGVEVLERLGVLGSVVGAPLAGIRYHVGDDTAEARFPETPARGALGLGQRRTHLDRVLLEAAANTPGVSVRCGERVRDVLVERGRVVGVQVGSDTYRAPLTLGADGAGSTVRSRLSLNPSKRNAGRLGIRAHFQLTSRQEQGPWVEIFLGQDYEFYLTPLPERQVLVACLMPAAQVGGLAHATTAFQERLRAHRTLNERLHDAVPLSPFMARAPLATRARSGWFPGALLLGDAAESFDPITGGGMAQALVSSEALAPYALRALSEGDVWLARFDRERRRRQRDHRWLTAFVLAMAGRPRIARPLLRFLAGQPRLFGHLVGVAAGTRSLLGLPLAASPAKERDQLSQRRAEDQRHGAEGDPLPVRGLVEPAARHE
jgi:2-polyprenyl-6-methoxyphenol hydroxylase-like FAD-dependent oxidoreductase